MDKDPNFNQVRDILWPLADVEKTGLEVVRWDVPKGATYWHPPCHPPTKPERTLSQVTSTEDRFSFLSRIDLTVPLLPRVAPKVGSI